MSEPAAGDGGRGRPGQLRRAVRGALLSVGLAVLGLALAIVFVPAAGESIPLAAAVEALGSDYVVVAVVGVAAVGAAGVVAVARRLRGVDEATPPAVEGVRSASYPGKRLDRSTGRLRRSLGMTDDDDRVDRLRAAATRATMRVEGCSRRTAEQRVAEGRWTDDPVASRYLAAPDRDGGRRRPRASLRTDRAFRRTVDAVERLGDGRRPPGSGVEGSQEVEG